MSSAVPPAVLAQHVAIVGKTGSGKTSTEKLIVEQVVDVAELTELFRRQGARA